MSNKNRNWDVFDIALVVGIVLLALSNTDGWGWLTFILFLRKT
jgi:hypothetical protein